MKGAADGMRTSREARFAAPAPRQVGKAERAASHMMPCPECCGSGLVVDPVYLGARVRSAREATGESLRAVANRLGCSAPFLCDLEKGRRGWSGEVAQKVLALYGIT